MQLEEETQNIGLAALLKVSAAAAAEGELGAPNQHWTGIGRKENLAVESEGEVTKRQFGLLRRRRKWTTMEMDGHLHSSPPVTAFAICFRPSLARSSPVPSPPSRPLSDFTTTRAREPHFSGQREVARRSHMKREGQFLEWPLSVGRTSVSNANVFFFLSRALLRRRRARGKNHFSALFSKRADKKGVAVAKNRFI